MEKNRICTVQIISNNISAVSELYVIFLQVCQKIINYKHREILLCRDEHKPKSCCVGSQRGHRSYNYEKCQASYAVRQKLSRFHAEYKTRLGNLRNIPAQRNKTHIRRCLLVFNLSHVCSQPLRDSLSCRTQEIVRLGFDTRTFDTPVKEKFEGLSGFLESPCTLHMRCNMSKIRCVMGWGNSYSIRQRVRATLACRIFTRTSPTVEGNLVSQHVHCGIELCYVELHLEL